MPRRIFSIALNSSCRWMSVRVAFISSDFLIPRDVDQSGRSESRANSMKVSVLLSGNSANTVCMTSDKGKVAGQQQVGRQTGVRGNLQLLCNWSKAAKTGNYKRKPLPHNGALSCLFMANFAYLEGKHIFSKR